MQITAGGTRAWTHEETPFSAGAQVSQGRGGHHGRERGQGYRRKCTPCGSRLHPGAASCWLSWDGSSDSCQSSTWRRGKGRVRGFSCRWWGWGRGWEGDGDCGAVARWRNRRGSYRGGPRGTRGGQWGYSKSSRYGCRRSRQGRRDCWRKEGGDRGRGSGDESARGSGRGSRSGRGGGRGRGAPSANHRRNERPATPAWLCGSDHGARLPCPSPCSSLGPCPGSLICPSSRFIYPFTCPH